MTDRPVVAEIEREYILSLLESGRRIDGRAFDEFRDIKIELNYVPKAEGSAFVTLGKTKVIAGVKAVVGTPFPDTPNEGVILVGAERSPIASPDFESGPPDPETIELARVTDRIIRESKFIDPQSLVLVPGEKVWTLFIDLYALDHDGNLFDAASIAAISALASAKIPKAIIKEDGSVELDPDDPQPLKYTHIPASVTTVKIGEHHIVDPTLKEERVSSARLTVGYKDLNTIVSAQKGEIGVFKFKEVLDIVRKGAIVADHVRSVIKEALNNYMSE